MTEPEKYRIINYLIGAVWLVNGLYCKVLDRVPRHRQIVGRILGEPHARAITVCIGLAEIAMSVWVVSGLFPRLNAVTQILIIAAMNSLEFALARDLLLWGQFNALFAFLFAAFIFYHRYYLNSPGLTGVAAKR